jgi:hypothetical protein
MGPEIQAACRKASCYDLLIAAIMSHTVSASLLYDDHCVDLVVFIDTLPEELLMGIISKLPDISEHISHIAFIWMGSQPTTLYRLFEVRQEAREMPEKRRMAIFAYLTRQGLQVGWMLPYIPNKCRKKCVNRLIVMNAFECEHVQFCVRANVEMAIAHGVARYMEYMAPIASADQLLRMSTLGVHASCIRRWLILPTPL